MLGIFAGAKGVSIVDVNPAIRHFPESLTDESATTYDLLATDGVLVDGAAVVVGFYEQRPSSRPWLRAIRRESEYG